MNLVIAERFIAPLPRPRRVQGREDEAPYGTADDAEAQGKGRR